MSTNTEVKDAKMFRLNQEQFDRLSVLHGEMKDGTTWNEAFERVFDQGLYQLEYRYGAEAKEARRAYAKRRAAEVKEAMKTYKQAQKDPELAVKLGLGKRVEL